MQLKQEGILRKMTKKWRESSPGSERAASDGAGPGGAVVVLGYDQILMPFVILLGTATLIAPILLSCEVAIVKIQRNTRVFEFVH